MHRTPTAILAAIFLSLTLAAPAHADAGMEQALMAHKFAQYHIALPEFRRLAGQGNSLAQFKLGQLYDNGQGVKQDAAMALSWYRKAAAQDQTDALFTIAHMYKSGRVVTRDYAKAMRWFRRAAELGHADSQAQLGVMYFVGMKVERDRVEAHKWLTIAAALGDDLAPRYRDIVARRMTRDQIVLAGERALAWMAAFAQKQTDFAAAAR